LPVLAVWLGALALTALAAWRGVALWKSTPHAQTERLDSDQIIAAFQDANAQAPADVRDGLLLASLSHIFTAAMLREDLLADAHARTNEFFLGVRTSQLGRLQQAALALLDLDAHGAPPEVQAVTLQPYLSGLDRASLTHHEAAVLAHNARVFRTLGVSTGTAAELARLRAGHPHNPLLEFLAPRLEALAENREQAGDNETASTYRRLVLRWLRDWVLEPGQAGTRLLAAQQLADAGPASSRPVLPADLSTLLRTWRASYLDESRRRPVELLGSLHQPCVLPQEHDALVRALSFATWTAGACAPVVLLGLIGGVALLFRRTSPLGRGSLLAAALGALLVVLVHLLTISFAAEWIRADFRRDFTTLSGCWRHPLLAAGLAVLATTLLGAFAPRPQHGPASRAARLAAVWLSTWLILAAVLLALTIRAESRLAEYQSHLGAALDAGEMQAMLGPDAEQRLAPLRAWTP